MKVLLGRIEPLVREALRTRLSTDVVVHTSTARGAQLLSEGVRRGAAAIVTSKRDAEMVRARAPSTMLIIGISSDEPDVLVSRAGQAHHLSNPQVDAIDRMLHDDC